MYDGHLRLLLVGDQRMSVHLLDYTTPLHISKVERGEEEASAPKRDGMEVDDLKGG